MSADGPVKALLTAIGQDPAPVVHTIQRLTPDLLCFFLPEASKTLVETEIHPQLTKMPQRWDWILTPDPQNFALSHRALAEQLPHLLTTWGISSGELVVDLTSATPGMAAAMTLVCFPYTSKIVALNPTNLEDHDHSKGIVIEGTLRVWTHSNPWDEEASQVRKEACQLFNQGAYGPSAQLFMRIERRVSGGLKPLYRALADLAEGYRLWQHLQYRQSWEKLKTATKALDLAAAWGGPQGLDSILRSVKDNVRFLEQVVLDPQEIKSSVALDLLAHAKRIAEQGGDFEVATKFVLRALEAFSQGQLYKKHQIKSWDVALEQMPQALKETCRTCYLNDIDGKYRLPLLAQFRALAGLGDAMGQTFLSQWPQMKTLFDAADHAILGQGFDPLKAERFNQLYGMVLKLSGTTEASLPKFPSLTL